MTEETTKPNTIKVCFCCGTTKTYPGWYYNPPIGVLCAKCARKLAHYKEYQTPKHRGSKKCYACGTESTYRLPNGKLCWFINRDINKNVIAVLCHSCHQKYILKPNRNREKDHQYNLRKIMFKDRFIAVDKPPRIGVCNLCRAVVGIDCKTTQMNHEQYHEDNPLKDTIELCASCHRKWHLSLIKTTQLKR